MATRMPKMIVPLMITVVTNTVNMAMELSKRKDLHVFVTGGHLRGDWFSLVGPTALEGLTSTVIGTLFIGADGIDASQGVTCYNPDEVDVNGTMVKHARRKIVLVDHSKFGNVAGWRICTAEEVDVLIRLASTIAQLSNLGD